MIEHARSHAVTKPWGVEDLRPWSTAASRPRCDRRNLVRAARQRRPQFLRSCSSCCSRASRFPSRFIRTMRFAHSMGLPNGKTEAWYVLSAAPEAKVALGLSRRLTPQQLREAIDDGSISDLVVWHAVSASDVIFVPAGTIHAIGAGLVIAELQQRSDTTFRLFDHGRQRELHIENAILGRGRRTGRFSGAAEPAHRRTEASRFQPTLRIRTDRSCRQIPLGVWKRNERLGFSFSAAALSPDRSTIAAGDALFAQSDRVDIHPGAIGMVGLVAYTGGGPVPHLLQRLTPPDSIDVGRQRKCKCRLSHSSNESAPRYGRLETMK